MSSAKANQGWHHHVNKYNEEYLMDIFKQLGYDKDEVATAQIIAGMGPRKPHWLLRRSFVLRRKVPVCFSAPVSFFYSNHSDQL